MQKWEYHRVDLTSDFPEGELNALGEDGWELVALVWHNIQSLYTAFLKRPKKETGKGTFHSS